MQRSLLSLRASIAPRIASIINKPINQQILSRSLSLNRPVLTQSPSTPAAPTPAPAAAPQDAEPKSLNDIVQRFGGWYPLVGLAGVIAVSKEVIILNEEFLLASNFATMFATLYLTMGDTLTKAAEEQRAEIQKKHDEISDFNIEQIQAVLQAHQLNIEQVEVLKRLKEEHNTLSAQLKTARAIKVRQSARDAVVKKLTELKAREASERASFKEVVGIKATAYVKRQFAAQPAAVKASLVDFAIDVLEGKQKFLPAEKDPVKKLYAEYFEQALYEQEIKQDKAKQ